ncbi:MAG: lysophospholipid acyltransferase family protein [Thiogranum sp.]
MSAKAILTDSILKLSSHIPYGLGARILAWICRQRWIQSLFFRPGLDITRRFLPLANPDLDVQEVMARSLAANFMGSWRLIALDRSSPKTFAHWVRIKGADILESAYREDKGLIVVNAHYGIPRMAPVVISRMGHHVLSLEAVDLFTRLGIAKSNAISIMKIGGKENTPLLREVYTARKGLAKGDILHLAADGSFGTSGIDFALHGKARPFAAGFAELALHTGAKVVPVWSSIDVDGHLTVEFLPVLDPGSDDLEHSDRVRHLIQQYVAGVEKRYSDDPGNVRWVHFHRFFALPGGAESPSSAGAP